MPAFNRISIDPLVMNGQPCIRGLRITVRRVLEAMALYEDRKELFAEFPDLEPEDLQQALEFAAASLADDDQPRPPQGMQQLIGVYTQHLPHPRPGRPRLPGPLQDRQGQEAGYPGQSDRA